ncbi:MULTISPECIES: hypothetical protein [unclassified Streptomyces]|nr:MULTISPECIES: hypothetical protein [unclassified Streptomyces]
MERLPQLRRRVDQLLPPMVGRIKRMGVSWEVIGRMLTSFSVGVTQAFY